MSRLEHPPQKFRGSRRQGGNRRGEGWRSSLFLPAGTCFPLAFLFLLEAMKPAGIAEEISLGSPSPDGCRQRSAFETGHDAILGDLPHLLWDHGRLDELHRARFFVMLEVETAGVAQTLPGIVFSPQRGFRGAALFAPLFVRRDHGDHEHRLLF